MFLSRVRAHRKSAAATRRVQNDRIRFPDRKGVDHIDDFRLGVVLSPPMPLLRSQEILKNVPNQILIELSEIEFVEEGDQRSPALDRLVRYKRNPVNESAFKDGLVIVCYQLRFMEERSKVIPKA